MNNRLNEIIKFLKENQIDCGLVTSRHNIFYLSQFDYEPHERFIGIFLFREKEPLMVVPAMEVPMVRESGWKYEIKSYKDSDNVWEIIKHTLEPIKSIAVEKENISYSYIEHFLEINPVLKLSSLGKQLENMRLIKNTDELELLKKAAEFADLAVEIGISSLKEGISEIEVMSKIEYTLKLKGIREMSFAPVVLFGENASNPHGAPGERRLRKGDVVLFDLGVKYRGYSSDITRTVVFEKVNEEIERIYQIVLNANKAGIQACQPGTRMGEIDIAARKVIEKAGYGDYFPHRIGHGLGIDVHETPSLSENNNGILQSGMLITIEPGIYLNGKLGVRIEDDVVITDNGCAVLTKFPKELLIIKQGEALTIN